MAGQLYPDDQVGPRPYLGGQLCVVPIAIEEPAAVVERRAEPGLELLRSRQPPTRQELEAVQLDVGQFMAIRQPLGNPALATPGGPTTKTRSSRSGDVAEFGGAFWPLLFAAMRRARRTKGRCRRETGDQMILAVGCLKNTVVVQVMLPAWTLKML